MRYSREREDKFTGHTEALINDMEGEQNTDL
jgi:hypothetical protein